MRMILASLLAMFSATAFAGPIDVQVAFIEALDPTDTTSYERFRKEYELAIQYGIELTAKEVADSDFSCTA